MKSMYQKFRTVFICGLAVLFSSLFLEWYIFQVFDSSGKLVAYWIYNPITGWTTKFSGSSTINHALQPKVAPIPMTMIIIFIVALLLSAYSVLFKDFEHENTIEKAIPYSYVHFFLLVLNFYFIFVFPVFYLFADKYFFPFARVKDPDLNFIYHYAIGPGYWMQVIGFLLIFPYTLFCYHTITTFKSEAQAPEKMINEYIQSVQEPLDLDKLIAKEQVKLNFKDDLFLEPEQVTIYQKEKRKQKFAKRW